MTPVADFLHPRPTSPRLQPPSHTLPPIETMLYDNGAGIRARGRSDQRPRHCNEAEESAEKRHQLVGSHTAGAELNEWCLVKLKTVYGNRAFTFHEPLSAPDPVDPPSLLIYS